MLEEGSEGADGFCINWNIRRDIATHEKQWRWHFWGMLWDWWRWNASARDVEIYVSREVGWQHSRGYQNLLLPWFLYRTHNEATKNWFLSVFWYISPHSIPSCFQTSLNPQEYAWNNCHPFRLEYFNIIAYAKNDRELPILDLFIILTVLFS